MFVSDMLEVKYIVRNAACVSTCELNLSQIRFQLDDPTVERKTVSAEIPTFRLGLRVKVISVKRGVFHRRSFDHSRKSIGRTCPEGLSDGIYSFFLPLPRESLPSLTSALKQGFSWAKRT